MNFGLLGTSPTAVAFVQVNQGELTVPKGSLQQ